MIKTGIRTLFNNTQILFDKNIIFAIWDNSNNWGDALSPVLIQKISGKKVLLANRFTYNIKNVPVYSVIGSILELPTSSICGDKKLVVWGTGFISSKGRLKVRPKEICAVRGPLTRNLLLQQGHECPEIYGDPALLFPRFYHPTIQKKYKLGIIPHYIDSQSPFISNFQNEKDVKIINISGGIYKVVDQICSCQKIASSSLHGIIAADAYGVSSTWIEFSNRVVGNGFKFHDYFQSIGRMDEKPLKMSEKITIDDIINNFYQYKFDLDLKNLWDVCPFKQV